MIQAHGESSIRQSSVLVPVMKEWGTFRGWRGWPVRVSARGRVGRGFGEGEMPRLSDVCLAHRAEFFAIDQPGIDLVEVKDVMTGQFADTITLGKLGEANCAFEL